jgi:hypothetical protein
MAHTIPGPNTLNVFTFLTIPILMKLYFSFSAEVAVGESTENLLRFSEMHIGGIDPGSQVSTLKNFFFFVTDVGLNLLV